MKIMKTKILYSIILLLISISSVHAEKTVCNQTSNIKARLSDMSLSGGAFLSGDYQITAHNITEPVQVLHPVYTTIERMSFTVSFTVKSDATSIRFGKGYCYADIVDNIMSIYKINGSLDGSVLLETIDLPFKLTAGKKYNVSIQKIDGYQLKYSIVSIDDQFEKLYNVETGAGFAAVRAWGQAVFGVKNGTVLVHDAIIATGYDQQTIVSFWGDSFLDAANLVSNGGTFKDRYCDLVAQHLGYGKVPIMARTGHALDSNFVVRFKIENSYFKSPFVFLAMGTNNMTVDGYKTYVQQCITEVKQNGQTPILVTITPRVEVDYLTVTKVINDWVKSSGEKYVDICNAVTDGKGNWKPEYITSDGVHPTVAGEHAMFRQIQLDIPELFCR